MKASTPPPRGDMESRAKTEDRYVSWKRKRLAFLTEMLVVFAVYLPFALMAPFFPIEADDEFGISVIEIGILFSVFAGISSIFSIVIGRFLPQIGPKFAFVTGVLVVGVSTVLVGVQRYSGSRREFFWFSFATFFVWGMGHATTNTSCTAMISHFFPGNEPALFAVMEAFIGLGFLLGAPIGSGFYKLGGYPLAFYVYGGLAIVLGLLSICTLPSFETVSRPKASGFRLLRFPSVWTTCLALTFTFALLGIITVGLSFHLTQHFGIARADTGFFWVLSGVLKMVSAILINSLTRKLAETNNAAARLILITGLIIGCVTFLLVGPSHISHLPHHLALVCIGLALEGFTKSCVVVPALADISATVRWNGLGDDFETESAIAGLFWGAFSFGTFLGPIIGGLLINYFGFVLACNLGAVGFLFMAGVVFIQLLWEFRCGKGRRYPCVLFTGSDSDSSTASSVPLLSNKPM